MDWHGDRITIEDITYRATIEGAQHPDEWIVMKPREAVEEYVRLVAAEKPRRIMELGIFGGGSTAFLAQVAQPERLAALDLRGGCRNLDRFLATHPYPVDAFYGVDQADTDALARIVAGFDGPLDLVIDDASHLLEPTRVSFDRLFPHLRPGGLYIIEDWGWRYQGPGQDAVEVEPMTPFIVDLLVVAARRPKMIREVVADSFSVRVRRGDADLRAGRFALAAHTARGERRPLRP